MLPKVLDLWLIPRLFTLQDPPENQFRQLGFPCNGASKLAKDKILGPIPGCQAFPWVAFSESGKTSLVGHGGGSRNTPPVKVVTLLDERRRFSTFFWNLGSLGVPNWDDVMAAGRTPDRHPMNTTAATTPSSSDVDDMPDMMSLTTTHPSQTAFTIQRRDNHMVPMCTSSRSIRLQAIMLHHRTGYLIF